MKLNLLPTVPMTIKPKDKLYGIGFMCLATLFWVLMDSTGLFIPSGYTSFQTVWMRYGIHLIFMLAVFGPRHRTNLIKTKMLKLQLIRPLLMIGMPLFFIFSLSFMSLHNTLSIFWVTPLMILSMGFFLLGEKVNVVRWASALIGLVGVLLILHPNHGALGWSAILPLGMAFCFSLYGIMTRTLYTDGTLTNLFYTALVVFIPWSLGLPLFWQPLNLQALISMVMIGILGYMGLFFLDKAYEYASATIVAPFTYSQPIFYAISSSLIFRHFPRPSTIFGSLVLIGVGLFLVFYEANLLPSHIPFKLFKA
ncbi:MAG: DMT family transporter [Anaerolineae bacterium]|nr:DMT family transporter [Anaerolineae bacterium]